jgi:hypothetical protein
MRSGFPEDGGQLGGYAVPPEMHFLDDSASYGDEPLLEIGFASLSIIGGPISHILSYLRCEDALGASPREMKSAKGLIDE